MTLKYEELASQLYKTVLSEYNNRAKWDKRSLSMMLDEHLKEFNEEAQKLIEQQVYDNLNNAYFPTLASAPSVASSVELSSMLYKNAKETVIKVNKILLDGVKSKTTIKEIAMNIYDGYNSDIDNLDVDEKLPKYLLNDKDAMKQVDKLKNTTLKYSYQKVLKKLEDINAKGLDKAMWVALQERARYYANRIAKTEAHRANMLSRAKEYMEDEEVQYVRYEMSSGHPKVDICDFYAGLDMGYGRGVVKKEDMRTLPLHPHCHCVYSPHYEEVNTKGTKSFKKASREAMSKFSEYEQRQIVGSKDKLREFKDGAGIEGLFNRLRPKYKIGKYSDVLYNGGMEKIEDKIIANFENVKDDISGKFGDLWRSEKHLNDHIERRVNLGHIKDKKDYIDKTLDCLANSDNFIFAQHKNSWDNICYNKSKDWAVIFNENGKMMTSYKVEPFKMGFIEKQKKFNAKIKKGVPNDRFKQFFRSLRK